MTPALAATIGHVQSSQYFGCYNVLGKFSSILGPVLAGTVALVSGS